MEWKEPYPITLDELNKQYTSRLFGRIPNDQDVLIYGLLYPFNLLDIVRNFVAFEVEGGKTVKKIARYQQFIAVNKAMERIAGVVARRALPLQKRGGVIWHTQGSGKSLSMLWLAVKLKRCKKFY